MGCSGSKASLPTTVPVTAHPVASVAPAAAGGKCKARRDLKFQVTLASRWQDYDKEEDAILKKAYLVGHKNAKYSLRGHNYEYNFGNMFQRNLDTGKIREIRAPPGLKPPPAPLLPKGLMVILTVRAGQAGKTIRIDDPNNPGKKISVNVPSGAKKGQKMAVPVPEKGEDIEAVQQRQKGHSIGAKLAMGTAGVAAVGGLAVGGVILGDHLSGGAVGDAIGVDIGDAVADAGEAIEGAAVDVADAVAPVAEDVGEWLEGAGETIADGAEDAVDWLGDAGEDVGDFVMSLF